MLFKDVLKYIFRLYIKFNKGGKIFFVKFATFVEFNEKHAY